MFLSLECRRLLKELMTLDPSKKRSLKDVLEDLWVNMGQERLRPYQELPCDNRDSWVTQVMMNMGFEWDKIDPHTAASQQRELTKGNVNSERPDAEGPSLPILEVSPLPPGFSFPFLLLG